MLVDPRPYTYEYRKPRYSNPTLYSYIDSASHAISLRVSIIATLTSPPMTTSLLRNVRCTLQLTNSKNLSRHLKNIAIFNATIQNSKNVVQTMVT